MVQFSCRCRRRRRRPRCRSFSISSCVCLTSCTRFPCVKHIYIRVPVAKPEQWAVIKCATRTRSTESARLNRGSERKPERESECVVALEGNRHNEHIIKNVLGRNPGPVSLRHTILTSLLCCLFFLPRVYQFSVELRLHWKVPRTLHEGYNAKIAVYRMNNKRKHAGKKKAKENKKQTRKFLKQSSHSVWMYA